MAIDATAPGWFDTEKIFALGEGWYFGSRNGLHVGPYANHKVARAKGEKIGKRLRLLATTDEQLSFVRSFLNKEWEELGASGNFSAPTEHVGEATTADAVRAGERESRTL